MDDTFNRLYRQTVEDRDVERVRRRSFRRIRAMQFRNREKRDRLRRMTGMIRGAAGRVWGRLPPSVLDAGRSLRDGLRRGLCRVRRTLESLSGKLRPAR